MKNTFKFLFFAVTILFSAITFAQSTVTGSVLDAEISGPLPGANILEKGKSNGVSTDFDGKFTLKTQETSGEIVISYIGYGSVTLAFNGDTDLGEISLASDNSLEEVVIVGVVDIAKDRQTPVAVSTIRASDIVEKLGNQELPELLNATPSVYATKSGGGFGDSRINIRGFDQRNTAVLINGVPVNDMENGAVFWSNWTGLADVASAIQVQRGLGSSKLAISSVGGTLNIVTKTTDRKEGGFIGTTTGNNDYLKTIASYSTGKMENGFAFSSLFSRTAGDGYVTGTSFEGYNFFLGLGWSDKEDKHSLQLTATGAPQVHNQRTTSFFNMATLQDYLDYGRKYNYNHGYLNGEEFNWRRNFYNKPVVSLNWDWKVSEKSKVSTVAYASWGRGGGTGDLGRLGGRFSSDRRFRDTNNGNQVRWNEIVQSNSGAGGNFGEGFDFNNEIDPYTGTFIVNDADLRDGATAGGNTLPGVIRRNGFIRRASINSHNWYGLLANFNTELSETLTLDAGVDLRSYKGFHYRRIDNLLGADGYRDNNNINKPFNVISATYDSEFSSIVNVFKNIDEEEKIDYYNTGLVRWAGVFGQLEYNKEQISAFVQFGVSNQGFKREDFFNYLDNDPNQVTDWENILGGNVKGGLNYNIDDNNNVFVNLGYYSRQPFFDAVYINFRNDLNEDYRNEKVLGTEVGYGLRLENFRANVNLYRTSWKDRFITVDKTFDTDNDGLGEDNIDMDDDDDVQGTANISGVEQVHMGIEFEMNYKALDWLSFSGMASFGNWEYRGNPSGTAFDQSQAALGDVDLILDGVKVGDAAQVTYRLGTEVELVKNLRFDLGWFNASSLYANFNADEFADTVDDAEVIADNGGFQLELPSYDLVDAGISFKLEVGKNKSNAVNLRLNVNNVFDEVYLAESRTNLETASDPTDNFNGVNTRNKVFFGFGRTWNASIRYNF